MEVDCDDVLEEWFVESLKAYKDLYVYQLESPTEVIEWTSPTTVCVAGNTSTQNEILELSLPPKLFAGEKKGLCAERDFRVLHGGFTDCPVFWLRHVPGTRCVVTNDGRSSDLLVWDLGGDDSDVIRKTGCLEGMRKRSGSVSGRGSRIAARLSSQPQVLHGSQSGDIRLTDLTSGKSLYEVGTDSADPLSSLQFVSDSVFLAGCCNGNIYVCDTRTSAAPQLSPPPASPGDAVRWWSDASAGPSCCRIVRLSSSGHTVISDLRNPGGVLSQAQLYVQTHRCNLDQVQVSWSPTLLGCIAISESEVRSDPYIKQHLCETEAASEEELTLVAPPGFDGAVWIYNTSAWSAEQQEAKPLFQHGGHAVSSQSDDGVPVLVTSHVWHPERPQTLLSAGSDGSVHVWDWVDKSAGS